MDSKTLVSTESSCQKCVLIWNPYLLKFKSYFEFKICLFILKTCNLAYIFCSLHDRASIFRICYPWLQFLWTQKCSHGVIFVCLMKIETTICLNGRDNQSQLSHPLKAGHLSCRRIVTVHMCNWSVQYDISLQTGSSDKIRSRFISSIILQLSPLLCMHTCTDIVYE